MRGSSRCIANLRHSLVRSDSRKQKMTDLAMICFSARPSIVRIAVMMVVSRFACVLQHKSWRNLVGAELEQQPAVRSGGHVAQRCERTQQQSRQQDEKSRPLESKTNHDTLQATAGVDEVKLGISLIGGMDFALVL